jgi:hypothetical protein
MTPPTIPSNLHDSHPSGHRYLATFDSSLGSSKANSARPSSLSLRSKDFVRILSHCQYNSG